jgi:uncharacterized protein (DUF1800 family)
MRSRALGNFHDLLIEVTRDPAMLLWLSGTDNTKYSPNENYGREVMELFTLGADRGYTQRDVHAQARALTGFTNDWRNSGPTNFRFDPDLHDTGVKRIFGHRGRFDWRDSCRLCVEHPLHPSFLVEKLWGTSWASLRRLGPGARSSESMCAADTRCGRSSRQSCAIPRSARVRGW